MAELALAQHGRAARRQLLAIGVTARSIERRLEDGRLHPEWRGVYGVGYAAQTQRGRWMGAVLAAGDDAVLSHRSAAGLWGIRAAGGAIHVTSPRRLRVDGLAITRASLPSDERDVVDGIPVTSVARTLLDLAEVLPRRAVEAALNEAEFHRLGGPVSLGALVHRHPRHRGAHTVRALLAAGNVGRTRTRGEFEELMVALCDAAGLPRPAFNEPLGVAAYEGDAIWFDRKVVVELDGWQSHGRRSRFEADRRRDRRLVAAGWRIIRVTWLQLEDEPWAIAADLAAVLSSAGRSPSSSPAT